MYAKSAVISGNQGSKSNLNERRIEYSIQRKIYMPSLKQQHFYYGAILSAIIEYNPDTHAGRYAAMQREKEWRNHICYRTQQTFHSASSTCI